MALTFEFILPDVPGHHVLMSVANPRAEGSVIPKLLCANVILDSEAWIVPELWIPVEERLNIGSW